MYHVSRISKFLGSYHFPSCSYVFSYFILLRLSDTFLFMVNDKKLVVGVGVGVVVGVVEE
jgi:hypothetical protein